MRRAMAQGRRVPVPPKCQSWRLCWWTTSLRGCRFNILITNHFLQVYSLHFLRILLHITYIFNLFVDVLKVRTQYSNICKSFYFFDLKLICFLFPKARVLALVSTEK